MKNSTLSDPLSRVTACMTHFMQRIMNCRGGTRVHYGLPAGALQLSGIKLIVAATPCDAPIFNDAMWKAANATGGDVILARHGLHPEMLNDVSFSAVVHFEQQPRLFRDLLLYATGCDEHWLVPQGTGAFIQMHPAGLRLTHKPPFASRLERSDGVCSAAAQIVKALRSRERF